MVGVSRTAIGVGMLRAAHRLVDAEPWVIDDPVSVALFGDAVRAMLANQPSWFSDERRSALRGHVLVRSAFAEERMRAAALRGVRQYVALGAGFDTFAYRQPAWMKGTRVFEVDAPATQAEKRRRLAQAHVAEPANVVFAAVDFECTSLLEGLCNAGFDATQPAFFSWLGVMPYLTAAAVASVFRFVASLPPGSEIAFTFAARDVNESLARKVAEIGEPFRTRIDREELEPMLCAFGFRDLRFLANDEAQMMLGARRDALLLPPRASIAAAIV